MAANQIMAGKRGLIMGLANDHSLAWGIAKALHHHGADLAFTYQSEALQRRIIPLAKTLNSTIVLPCDVNHEDHIDKLFETLEREWSQLDFIVHAIGFSDKTELTGHYINTSRKNFLNTMDVSCFSFTALANAAQRLMINGGSLLTLTYYGSEKVMPHYNVMGIAKAALEASVRYLAVDLGPQNIRVNALSAGPVRTLAAAGIGDFKYILNWNKNNAPLQRNITIDQVGNSALYLLSDLSSGVTGEVHYVDNGYNIIGMKSINAPDLYLARGAQ